MSGGTDASDDAPAPPFGALLQRYRVAAGLTQEVLAERAGVSPNAVSALERGARRLPQRETVRLLVTGLGLAPAEAAALEGAVARPRGPRSRPAAQAVEGGAAPVQEAPPAATADGPAAALPAGTVTFLFTDLEGSTRLLEADPRAYHDAVRRHHALLQAAVAAHGGAVFETAGDAAYAAFASPADAVAAAVAGQRALLACDWGALGAGALTARMALHTGKVDLQGARYFGAPLYRCARLLATAHGGQVVLSGATAELVQDELPGGRLRDLGAHRLKDLARPERVAQLLHPDLPAEFPPLRSLEALAHNLPVQPTQFVGREREVAAVRERLRRPGVRLLTLTGPGGVGKTRLALQAAADLVEAFPDGAWFVDLAPLREPALVSAAVAQALGIREGGGQPLLKAVWGSLREKRLLLVLDNCEHLLPGAAPLVADLLAAGPGLEVLATSRAPLGVRGEHRFPVPPLALPDPAHPPEAGRLTQYAAVALFVARARAARPDFAVTNENAPAVAGLCHRLDGLPLALELAAARVALLPPAALLARLGRRRPLLEGGPHDAPARQRTLRATLDWSHDLLGGAERALFRRLAVFSGGWTLEAAEAVGGAPDGGGDAPPDVVEGLASLADKSLLRPEPGPDDEPRFRMLETIREYALERLEASGEAAALRQRHAAHYLDLAEQAAPRLDGAEQARWLRRLSLEQDNFRAALRWALEAGDAELGLRLGGALWRFWWIRGPRREALDVLTRLLAAPGAAARAAARAAALTGAGVLATYLGHHDVAAPALEERLSILQELGDRAGTGWALQHLGELAALRGEVARARSLFEAAFAVRREVDDQRGLASVLYFLGHLERRVGDYPAARRRFEECLAIRRRLGDGYATRDLGRVALESGAAGEARARLEESLVRFREVDDRRSAATVLGLLGDAARAAADPGAAAKLYEESLALSRGAEPNDAEAGALCRLGELLLRRGNPRGAAGRFREGLTASRELNDLYMMAHCLAGLAGVAVAEGQPHRAARLAAAAEAMHAAAPSARPELADLDAHLERARKHLDAATFARAREEGRAMPPDEAIAYALEDEAAPAPA